MLRTTSTVTPSAQCAQLQQVLHTITTFKTSYLSLLVNVQDLSLLANVVDRLTTQNRKPSPVVLSEGERGLLEAHLHVLCHKLVHVSPVRGVPHHQTQLPTNHNDTAPTTKEKHS